MSFMFADPKQLWLEIPPEIETAARRMSRRVLSPGAQWQVYLNQLCVEGCLAWARKELDTTATAFPSTEAIPSWEMVTGSCLMVNGTKLALIPTDVIGQDELLVPQEWVDIPSWKADYYLAVKVNPDERWLEGWGYASYRQLREGSAYDTWARSYSLDGAELAVDIGALWTTLERCSPEAIQSATRPDIATDNVVLTALSAVQAENLIARLANIEIAFPRLSIPFAQWGALLADEGWRRQLCERRRVNYRGDSGVSLSQGLREMGNAIAAGWQSIEAVFGANAQQLAFGFRQGEQAEGRQAKEIRFDDNQCVRLVLLWQLEADGRLAIRAQLYPAEGELYVPTGITFSLVSDQEEVLQSIQSEEENNYIQLKRFKCLSGYSFGIEIQLGNQSVTERFVS